MSSKEQNGEYIIEFQQHGKSVKVSAVDTATMTEVSIIGPSNAGREELQRLAIQKLLFVLNKKAGPKAAETDPSTPKKPGIIV
ncbi:MAG: serine hydroxymethyltransferase [Proteobacteria bacterium]|nr:serine hydroxymethyltransferase [Pseudomonadota bacterium]